MTFDGDGPTVRHQSHTHQRATDYAGPEFDRIKRFRDTDGDGRADEVTTFLEPFSRR